MGDDADLSHIRTAALVNDAGRPHEVVAPTPPEVRATRTFYDPIGPRSRPAEYQAAAQAPDTPSPLPQLRYACLAPLVDDLGDIFDLDTAHALLDHYFLRPNLSLFHSASPYVLDPVLRRESLLRPSSPREVTPLLVATMLWVGAHTATLRPLHVPRHRKHVCERLEALVLSHLRRTSATHGRGANAYDDTPQSLDAMARMSFESPFTLSAFADKQPASTVTTDNFLACVLISIVVSGSDSKRDSLPWYHTAVRMARKLGLHQLDAVREPERYQLPGADRQSDTSHARQEALEERRRAFWILFALDRHWALCFNSMPLIHDHDCKVFLPLDDNTWQSPELSSPQMMIDRVYGPPLSIVGTGFFQWFLPLMTILGDIIWLRQQRSHPRLHGAVDARVCAETEQRLQGYLADVSTLGASYFANGAGISAINAQPQWAYGGSTWASSLSPDDGTGRRNLHMAPDSRERVALQLYATFVTHVLFILLHGRWDPLELLTRDDRVITSPGIPAPNAPTPTSFSTPLSDWITSDQFAQCSSHAIYASETLSKILDMDPELSFIPYLFGIYLLQGSFILLLFADRMLEVGDRPNASVEKACETIIRAHEACFVTLSVEFQRDFRKVLRRTLNRVRTAQVTFTDGMRGGDTPRMSNGIYRPVDGIERGIWREILELYRWTPGSHGLAP